MATNWKLVSRSLLLASLAILLFVTYSAVSNAWVDPYLGSCTNPVSRSNIDQWISQGKIVPTFSLQNGVISASLINQSGCQINWYLQIYKINDRNNTQNQTYFGGSSVVNAPTGTNTSTQVQGPGCDYQVDMVQSVGQFPENYIAAEIKLTVPCAPIAAPMYYCKIPEFYVQQTSSSYSDTATCEANLATYKPGQTTGKCYLTAAEAQAACVPPPPTPGRIIVDKVAYPSGDTQSFYFTTNGGSNFSLTDTATPHNSGDLAPGTYSVSESVLSGWTQTSATCSDNSPVNAISLQSGETVSCTFVNTKSPPPPTTGKITVVKDASPNDLKDFFFDMTGQPNFYLDDDNVVVDKGMWGDIDQPQSRSFNNLTGNTTYTISETVPAYWIGKSVVCFNTQNGTPYTPSFSTSISANNMYINLFLTSGADVTCTFTNEKKIQSLTRTQGFWQTHTAFTSSIFSTYFPNGMNIGTAPHKGSITNAQLVSGSQLFGAYYSNIAKKSNGGNRANVDKARMQLLQQLVTAKLNCAAFTCTSAIQSLIASADSAYAAGNISGMNSSISALDSYNKSGDTIAINPPLPPPGNATPSLSQSYANIGFWDQP